jgi:integrative and conjugative element protein (TIGR02256 family)
VPIARLAQGNRVLFDNTAVDTITQAARRSGHLKEVGGLLLGYRRGPYLHVKFATVPTLDDISEKFRFVRRGLSHQVFAYRAWIASGFRCGWIGEWHTHPEDGPVPSHVDLATWRDQVGKSKRRMVYMIVGTSTDWVGMLEPESFVPHKMTAMETTMDTVLFVG